MAHQFATVDEYIASFPDDVRDVLTEIRTRIRAALPSAGEKIAYQMATVTVDGRSLLHYAGWKNHVGLYYGRTTDDAVERELDPYRQPKGTLKFRLGEPIPYELIARLAVLLAASPDEPDQVPQLP